MNEAEREFHRAMVAIYETASQLAWVVALGATKWSPGMLLKGISLTVVAAT